MSVFIALSACLVHILLFLKIILFVFKYGLEHTSAGWAEARGSEYPWS